MADPENETDWNPDVIEIRPLTGDRPLGPGSQWEGRYRGMGTMRVRLDEYERPERLVFTTSGDRIDMRFVFAFSGHGVGPTHIVADADMTPKGPMRLIGPLFGPMMRRTMSKRPEQIAAGVAAAQAV
jgi:hypothetical protein